MQQNQGNANVEGQAEQSEALKVAIRVRPRLSSEFSKEEIIQVDNVKYTQAQTIRVTDTMHMVSSRYDRVFDQEDSQDAVYEFVSPFIQSFVSGYNTSIFAYGQTGSGKTHTMFGADWHTNVYGNIYGQGHSLDNVISHGIIPRAINNTFYLANSEMSSYTILCSFIQIYNERIYDLLQDNHASRPLNIREDTLFGMYVEGLAEYVVQNIRDCIQLIIRGDRNRAVRATKMNQLSSRSHSIFQIIIESDAVNKKGKLRRAKMNLCDLAGSEKYDKEGSMSKQHILEMKSINLSLTNLGKIIQGLSRLSKGQKSHLPYRDSKLTRLLQDSLGGNTKTCFIATVSPIKDSVEETINTLKFADRAKQVMVRVKKNEIDATNDKLVQKLQREIQYLRDILHMRKQGGIGVKEIQNRLMLLQEENEKLREVTQGISIQQVLHLKEENKTLRIQLQNLQQTAGSADRSGSPTLRYMQCFECGGDMPCADHPVPDELERIISNQSNSRIVTDYSSYSAQTSNFTEYTPYAYQTHTSAASTVDPDRPIEVRVRGKNALVNKQLGSVVNSLDDQVRMQQRRQERRRALERLRTLEKLEVIKAARANEALRKLHHDRIEEERQVEMQRVEEKKKRKEQKMKKERVREFQEIKRKRKEAEEERKKMEKELDKLKWQRRNLFKSPVRL